MKNAKDFTNEVSSQLDNHPIIKQIEGALEQAIKEGKYYGVIELKETLPFNISDYIELHGYTMTHMDGMRYIVGINYVSKSRMIEDNQHENLSHVKNWKHP